MHTPLGGTKLGPYEILELIGAGGMGEVYRARDSRLHRTVAIKVVRSSLLRHTDIQARFQREARAISALNHPHICSLYDIGEEAGLDYLVMEYVEGESLSILLKKGPLDLDQALRYGSEIADALEAAHAHGIIHRDLKPGNVIIAKNGAKVLDFGLAKRFEPASASGDGATLTMEAETVAGQLVGTVAYMSPEQAEGRPLTNSSDIFALGVLLYEMLSGKRPFGGETTLSTLASILRDEPLSLKEQRQEVPAELERIVEACLAKNPDDRYSSASEVRLALDQIRGPEVRRGRGGRVVGVSLAVLLIVALGASAAAWYRQSSGRRWAEDTALPQAARLVESSQPLAALNLLRQAERFAPTSAKLVQLKEDLRFLPAPFETDPPGAELYVTDYNDPNANDLAHWKHLGRAPLKAQDIPLGQYYRLRAANDGYEPAEVTFSNNGTVTAVVLHSKQETPPGMVWIPQTPAPVLRAIRLDAPAVLVQGFWLDKFEVTNRQFKEFVDAGGYQKREYWKQPFLENGKTLSWDDATARFRDASRRPGPATWEGGTYPDGQADYPVGGVSWYEASAYAEFEGKSLPTVYHWYVASGHGGNMQITSLSNFGGKGPAPVGANLGLGPYGTYDMAGNVKEWAANPEADKRYALGGGWTDATYMFQQMDLRSPFERSPSFGIRCARYPSPIPDSLSGTVATIPPVRRDQAPVDDRAFQIYKGLFTYDKTDLNATLDSSTDAPHWRQENVSFQAAYGKERVILHLYLPKDAKPPYQPVVYLCGINAYFARSPEEILFRVTEYIVKSGRALVLPAYAGTLERGPTPLVLPPTQQRDLYIQEAKDASRTVDYLETRGDIDVSKLGLYGLSSGAHEGVRVLATDPRFKAAVLMSFGAERAGLPEIDTWNYAPRVKVPVLVLNGREDWWYPVETSQVPMFKLLGTRDHDKHMDVFPGGHTDFADQMNVINEVLDWLDRYLGPVATKN